MRDYDLKDFQGVTRLFPLSGVVLFPHAVLPLHIFEPRYRQMMTDALLSDRMITIVQPALPPINTASGPALEPIGCLGHIVQYERLDDGRYNLLLAGLKRVRLTNELRTPGKLYREAQVDLLDDLRTDEVAATDLTEVSARFLQILDEAGIEPSNQRDLRMLVEKSRNAGMLTDLIAQSLGLPPVVRQAFLNETRVPNRVEQLLQVLRMLQKNRKADSSEERDFPPRFSQN